MTDLLKDLPGVSIAELLAANGGKAPVMRGGAVPDVGSFPLTDVSRLPNISVAFPGERWSDGKASEIILPGEMIVPINNGGKRYWSRAAVGAVDPRAAVAMNVVQSPDSANGSIYYEPLGPNEIVNRAIPVDSYVLAYRSGSFHLTLVKPDATYGPSDLIAWDPAGTRPTGKAGTGSWMKTATPANAFFEVEEWRPVNAAGTEGILTVRSLRGQF